jgi:2'-5' RNA ligase
VPAEDVHLTLAFIGAWPLAKLSALYGAAAAIRATPMRVSLDVQGGFRRAGVAWIAPSTQPLGLQPLAQALGVHLTEVGVKLETRAFDPHMTLARRCRGPYPHGAAGPYVWDVDAMTLMASDTRGEGSRYTALARWPLS